MRKITPILLGILVIGFAVLWLKQRSDYQDLKQQRITLRQEVEDLKVLRERAAKAYRKEQEKVKQADNKLGLTKKHFDRTTGALRQAQQSINGFTFRGWQPATGQRSYWQVLQISTIPDPSTTVYKDCLVTLKLKAQPHVKWKAAATPIPDRVITGIAWGYQDRALGPVSELKINDIIMCEVMAEHAMDARIKNLQLVDELDDLESDRYYLADLEATGTNPVQFHPIDPRADSARSREASIAADLARIGNLLEAHGGWDAWFAETETYRNELQQLIDENGGPLNHENRMYLPSIKPLNLKPSDEYPQLHVRIIKHLRDQLKQMNIDLIVAPVPTKEILNALFFLKAPPSDNVVSPYRLMLFKELLEADIEVIDFLDPLVEATNTHAHVFYDALDAHPADGAIQTVAHVLGQRLARYRLPPAKETLRIMQTRYRVTARFFESRSAVGFPYIATRLFHENMEPVKEYGSDESPILMITDSFAGVPSHYNVWSANIPAHIYKEIGVLPQKYQQNMGGPRVLQNFPTIPKTCFKNKKVCVFLFGEFYLAFPEEVQVKWIPPRD